MRLKDYKTLTLEAANLLYSTKWWESKTPKEIAEFQLYQDYFCCPHAMYHEALKALLGRTVWSHELADSQALRDEYEGKRTFEGVVDSFMRVAPPHLKAKLIVLEEER